MNGKRKVGKAQFDEWVDYFVQEAEDKKEPAPTPRQVYDYLLEAGLDVEMTWGGYAEASVEAAKEYGKAFLPSEYEKGHPLSWMPPLVKEGVPAAVNLLAGLGQKAIPWYRGEKEDYPEQALEQIANVAKHPGRSLYFDTPGIVANVVPGAGQVLGVTGKLTKLSKLASLGKKLQWASPLDELASLGLGAGLGALAEYTPGIGGKAKRAKQQGVTGQIDPDMLEFQQQGQQRGIIDPLDPKTGEGGLPAPVLSQDPGAIRVSKAVAQKGGDNAFLREVNQFEELLDFDEQTYRDSIDPSDPVAAVTAAREGLAKLEGKFTEMSKMFDELGLDQMETNLSNIRSTIATLEAPGAAGQYGSASTSVKRVLRNPNVQAFKKQQPRKRPTRRKNPFQREASEVVQNMSGPEMARAYLLAKQNNQRYIVEAIELEGVPRLQQELAQTEAGARGLEQQYTEAGEAIYQERREGIDFETEESSRQRMAVEINYNLVDEQGRRYRLQEVPADIDPAVYQQLEQAGLIEFSEVPLGTGASGPLQQGRAFIRRYQDSDPQQPVAGGEVALPVPDDPLQQVLNQMPEFGLETRTRVSQVDDLQGQAQQVSSQKQEALQQYDELSQSLRQLEGDGAVVDLPSQVVSDETRSLSALQELRTNLGQDYATWKDGVKKPGDYSEGIANTYRKLYRAATLDLVNAYASEAKRLVAADPRNAERYGQLTRLIDDWRETADWLETEPSRIIKTAVEKKWVDHPDGALDANGDVIKVPSYSELDVSTARQIVEGLFNSGWKMEPSLFKTGTLTTADMPMIREAIGPEAWHRLKAIWVHDTFEKARGPSGQISGPHSLQAELDKLGSHPDDINRRLVEIGGGGEEGQAFAKLMTDMSRRRGKSERLAGIFDDSATFSFDKVKMGEKRPSRAWDLVRAVGMTEAAGGVLLGRFLSPGRAGRAFVAKALIMGLEGYGDMLNNPRKYKMTAADLADAPSLAEMTARFKGWGWPVKHGRLARQVDQEEIKERRQSRRQARVSITPQAREAFSKILSELQL